MMSFTHTYLFFVIATILCFVSLFSQAYALPQVIDVSDEDGDASIRLQMEELFIKDDQAVYCYIEVVVVGDNRELRAGDTINTHLYEDDLIGDDSVWEREEIVTEEEAELQRFERMYDCSSGAIGDVVGNLEMYAQVEVDKQDCGFGCEINPLQGEDTATTGTIIQTEIDDDEVEDDDTRELAWIAGTTDFLNRVAKDEDWIQLNYTQSVELQATLSSNLAGGLLSLTLFDESGVVLNQAYIDDTTNRILFETPVLLSSGRYYLQVMPTMMGNFNFYDMIVTETYIMQECEPNSMEERACALCGIEIKTCAEDGTWNEWSECSQQGVCQPGNMETQVCNEIGTQQRVCTNECQWGDFGPCAECVNGATESCYSGNDETRGVGACNTGMRTCVDNIWGACQGEGRVEIEICNDGIDNDCDGSTDRADSECLGRLGDACNGDDECSQNLDCLTDGFADGYCGQMDCEQCTGVCSNLWNEQWCLQACTTSSDCRVNYVCVAVGIQGESACIPACEDDGDCDMNEMCQAQVCMPIDDTMTPMDDSMNPMNDTMNPIDDMMGEVTAPVDTDSMREMVIEDEEAMSTAASTNEGGCQQHTHKSSWLLLVLMGLYGFKRRTLTRQT